MDQTVIPARSSRPAKNLALCMIAGLVGCAALASASEHPDTTGPEWKDLISADFSNVDMKPGSWTMEDGVLVAKTHDTIWTKKSYGNFILDLEFKVATNANSGVFLRSGDTKSVLAALEVQVHDSADAQLYGSVGSIYNAQPPSKPMQKPTGEWNRYTITCNGPNVSLVFNGEEVWNVNLDDWKEPHLNPDGTPNKFKQALKNFSRMGPIGFQGLHGKEQAPVWYRNIRIKELN